MLVHEVMHREGTERMCNRLKEIKPNLMEHMIAGHTFGDDVGRDCDICWCQASYCSAFYTKR